MNIATVGVTWSTTNDPAVETARNIRFGQADGAALLLDLYRPAGPDDALPIVVYLHGGGWLVGTRTDREYERAVPLAARGFIVASVEYCLSGAAKFPAQLNDARQAVHWLKTHAAEFGGDGKRIAVSGASAGAHLAALLALAGPDDLVGGSEAERAARGVAADIRAVVSWFPVTDVVGWDVESRTAPPPAAGSFAAQGAARRGWPPPERGAALLGVKHIEEASPAVIASADPRTYIIHAVARTAKQSGRVPPFLVLHGDADSAVGLHHSRLLHEALRKGGVESTLLILVDADHEDPNFGQPVPLAAVAAFLQAALG